MGSSISRPRSGCQSGHCQVRVSWTGGAWPGAWEGRKGEQARSLFAFRRDGPERARGAPSRLRRRTHMAPLATPQPLVRVLPGT